MVSSSSKPDPAAVADAGGLIVSKRVRPQRPWQTLCAMAMCVTCFFGMFWLFLSEDVYDHRLGRLSEDLRAQQAQMAGLKECLLRYRQRLGRYPTNDEGLGALAWENVVAALPPEPEGPPRPRAGAFFRWEGGVMSAWHLPILYENRTRHAAEAFAHSPVHGDDQGHYSIRVSEGVFLYSVPAIGQAAELNAIHQSIRERRRERIRTGVTLVSVSAVLLVILLCLRLRLAPVIALAVSAVLGGLFSPKLQTTCYMMLLPRFKGRPARPEMIERQSQLIEKYHEAGVISQETYLKAKAAVDAAPTEYP